MNINNHYLRLFIFASSVMLLPFIANFYLEGFNWAPTDFIVMFVMIVSFGSLAIYLNKSLPTKFKHLTLALVVLAFLLLWAELAVGIFTTWGS